MYLFQQKIYNNAVSFETIIEKNDVGTRYCFLMSTILCENFSFEHLVINFAAYVSRVVMYSSRASIVVVKF